MSEVKFISPETIEQAVDAYSKSSKEGNTKILAGGTDLLVQIRSGISQPDTIIDIKNIKELKEISNDNGSYTIGAAVAGAVLDEEEDFGNNWPGVLEALRLIGSEQIQGRASLGGNLCNASPAGDSVPALIASGATVKIQGPEGERKMPIESFHVGPGKTNLKNGEIVVNFQFPKKQKHSGDAYLRMIPRTEMDIAVVGCAVNVTIENDKCVDARVALGAVAPTALLVEDASKALIGSNFEKEAVEKAALACEAACNPIDDKRGTISYRKKVSKVLFKRALEKAIEFGINLQLTVSTNPFFKSEDYVQHLTNQEIFLMSKKNN